jgi:hypothetical protein
MHREDADRERRCWSPNASRRWIHILPPQHRAADRPWLRILPRSGSALRGRQSEADGRLKPELDDGAGETLAAMS